jgi:Mor family transcriptional regulator
MSDFHNKWPEKLVEIYEHLVNDYLKDHPAEIARSMAERAALIMSEVGGGRVFYLPKAEKLKKNFRNNQIWKEFNGRNHENIAKDHNMSVQHIYKIIADYREANKSQMALNMDAP